MTVPCDAEKRPVFGTEYALYGNWTAKAEYNMMDFGSKFGTDTTVNVFKAGLNYRFGFSPPPVYSRY